MNFPKIDPKVFHDHLDKCRQCRENPMGLCAVGAAKLAEAAGSRISAQINIDSEGGVLRTVLGGPTYVTDGESITCLTCQMTSWSPVDVAKRYCGKCNKFHDA
tara:strand:- start:213 stop:521 length:309 start_codon:yes stop_codon:yes gene_type:complete